MSQGPEFGSKTQGGERVDILNRSVLCLTER